jgi:hypothetical protein
MALNNGNLSLNIIIEDHETIENPFGQEVDETPKLRISPKKRRNVSTNFKKTATSVPT